MRQDALLDTTAFRQDSNKGPLVWETTALPIARRPLLYNLHVFSYLIGIVCLQTTISNKRHETMLQVP